jgi:ribokinase
MSRIVVVSPGTYQGLLVSALERIDADVAGVDDRGTSRLADVADGCELLIITEDSALAAQHHALRWAAEQRGTPATAPPRRRSGPGVLLTALTGGVTETVWVASDVVVCTAAALARLSGAGVTDPLDAEDAAAVLTARTAATIIVSLDDEGAVVARRGRGTYLPPFTVDVVDPTGAWDCFCAALALGVVEGFDNFAATGYAMAAAAVCVGRPGGEASLPNRDDVERMAHSVDLRRDPGTAPLQFPS